MESVSKQNDPIFLDCPKQPEIPYTLTSAKVYNKTPLKSLLKVFAARAQAMQTETSWGDRLGECICLFKRNFRIHPDVISQLEGMFEQHKLNIKGGGVERALYFGAIPYVWENEHQDVQSGRWGFSPYDRPSRVAGPGIDWVVPIQIPYSMKELYGLARLFWRDMPQAERTLVCASSLPKQTEYYQYLWEQEGKEGLDRVSSDADPTTYSHTWVWCAVLKGKSSSTEQTAQLIKLSLQENSASSMALRPRIMDCLLRLWQRRLSPVTIFSSSNAEKGFPDYSKLPLPVPQSSLERCPYDLLSRILFHLDGSSINSLFRASRWLNATIGAAGNANLGIWKPVVQCHYPALSDLRIKNGKEWHTLFVQHQGTDWVYQLQTKYGTGESELFNVQVLSEWFPEMWNILSMRLWNGNTGESKIVLDRAQRLMQQQSWANIVAEGALLQPKMRQTWWIAIGKEIEGEQAHEIISRMDLSDYPTLIRGFYERSEGPLLLPLVKLNFPTFDFNERTRAGLAFLTYLRLDYKKKAYEVENYLKQWLGEQRQQSLPTVAVEAVLNALYQLLDQPRIASSNWKELFHDVLQKADQMCPALSQDLRDALPGLLTIDGWREIENC